MAQPPHAGRHRAPAGRAGRAPTLTLLAFQVWDAVGWAGQAVFTIRVLHQWIASERARRSVLPRAFWTWSLLGTAALVVYAIHRKDPVFFAGFLVNGALYVRNFWLAGRPPAEAARPRSPLAPVLFAVVLFLIVTAAIAVSGRGFLRYDDPWPWLAVGFTGQAVWAARFVVQWWVSERVGRSVLPPVFFRMSIAGALLSFAYAVHKVDWVMMFAYGLNPIPYVRNLVLLARERRAEAGPAGDAGEAPR